ncbi:MAG: 2-oxo-4-hydroxy-4-carboxy-5-ureidoimidazoline decarboxylase [Actinophytocola sp.]|nr:2-oxo-4-hydroxy-4-carboxy-5-ureidoimidazoline decarboxylase [Actinophytocola sp.]
MTLLEPAPGALLECCASRRWAAAVADGAPYDSLEDLLTASDEVLAGLAEQDVDEALSAHPRIGERATAPPGADHAATGRDAAWSRQEQAKVTTTPGARDELAEVNAAYEERFGRVFLVCATGLSADDILAQARRRLTHDAETEHAEVIRELGRIVRLRLAKLVDE